MQIKMFQEKEDLYVFAKDIVISEIFKKPNLTLGLAAGRTPTRLYELLVESAKSGQVSFANIKTVNLDEYVGVAPEEKQSFYTYTKRTLTDLVGVKKENAIALNGTAESLEAECREYENKIAQFGGIDLQLLGLGENGHVGFNEPGSSASSRTRVVELQEVTKKNLSENFRTTVPSQGITIGVANVLEARKIILIATGKSKATAVKNAFFRKPAPQWPASFCQAHKDVLVLIDKDAASLLTTAEEKLLGV